MGCRRLDLQYKWSKNGSKWPKACMQRGSKIRPQAGLSEAARSNFYPIRTLPGDGDREGEELLRVSRLDGLAPYRGPAWSRAARQISSPIAAEN